MGNQSVGDRTSMKRRDFLIGSGWAILAGLFCSRTATPKENEGIRISARSGDPDFTPDAIHYEVWLNGKRRELSYG